MAARRVSKVRKAAGRKRPAAAGRKRPAAKPPRKKAARRRPEQQDAPRRAKRPVSITPMELVTRLPLVLLGAGATLLEIARGRLGV